MLACLSDDAEPQLLCNDLQKRDYYGAICM